MFAAATALINRLLRSALPRRGGTARGALRVCPRAVPSSHTGDTPPLPPGSLRQHALMRPGFGYCKKEAGNASLPALTQALYKSVGSFLGITVA